MAAPSYTTDLITIATGDLIVDVGSWDESSDAAWDDAGSMVDDGNLYYNNTECVSAQYTKDGVGTIMYEHTSTFTVPTDGAILVHHLWAAPPALGTLANGGVRILVGNGFGVFYAWDCSGSDHPPAPRGGWANYAINPAIGSPDDTVGSPASPWDTVGMAVAATAQARGNPNAVNAIRYGRCTSIYEHGDLANGYATFAGYAAVDNSSTNRWNLLDPIKGGYEHQGLMSLGTTTNAVDFRDSNKNISIADTINVTANFNKIEVNNASSNVEWTAISISALGTTSKGKFEAVDNATILKKFCTFTDMDTFIYQSNSTIQDNTTYRRCGLVTQGGATFTNAIFDKPSGTVALLVNTGDVTKCVFNSDGTGHAINLGTVGTTQSITWDNTDSGYAATNGSTGNETILVNVTAGVTLTINVTATATTPTYYNTGAGTVSVVAGQKSFKFTVSPSITGYEWRIYDVTGQGSLVGATELAGEETATADNQTYTYSYVADDWIAVQIIDDNYEEAIEWYELKNADQDVTVNLSTEENT